MSEEHDFDQIARENPTAALIALDERVRMLEVDLTKVEETQLKLSAVFLGLVDKLEKLDDKVGEMAGKAKP